MVRRCCTLLVSERFSPDCTDCLSRARCVSMLQSTLAESFLADFDDLDGDSEDATHPAAQVSQCHITLRHSLPPRSLAACVDLLCVACMAQSASSEPPTIPALPLTTPVASTASVDVNCTSGSGQAEVSAAVQAEGNAAFRQSEVEWSGDDKEQLALTSLRPSSLSPLLTSGALPAHLSALSALLQSAGISSEREYPYLASSIRLLSSIDSEIALVHRYLVSVYSVRYSELEQLVASPVHYARVARLLANFKHDSDVSGVEAELQAFLPNNIVLTISVTAATSSGRLLSADELDTAMEAASTIQSLDAGRQHIVSYMESRMSAIAPNLSALVGPTIAAHLLSVAGGLRKLSEIPACNVQVLGSRKQRHSALSSVTQELHVGAIGQSAVMLCCPVDLRRKAARLLAGKVTLAARVDEHKEDDRGEAGRQMRAQVEGKIEMWQQAPPTALTRALPVPLAQSNKKRRGGKRFRRDKERYAVSELHKQKNRMAFGKEELVDEYTGEEFGMMGQQEGTGQVRARESDTQQLSKRLSRDVQRRMAFGAQKARGGAVAGGADGGVGGLDGGMGGAVTVIGGGGGGTASSIAFTPVQGMELVNNEQKRMKLADSEHSYFAATASFSKVHSQSATSGSHSSSGKQRPPVPTF